MARIPNCCSENPWNLVSRRPSTDFSIQHSREKAARERETFAEQLVWKARARIDEGQSQPPSDEPESNELTKQTIRDARAGENITRYADATKRSPT